MEFLAFSRDRVLHMASLETIMINLGDLFRRGGCKLAKTECYVGNTGC